MAIDPRLTCGFSIQYRWTERDTDGLKYTQIPHISCTRGWPVPRHKRSFGSIRKLPSGRYQGNYTGPDTYIHKAPHTFDTR